jgi:hypothetical protein
MSASNDKHPGLEFTRSAASQVDLAVAENCTVEHTGTSAVYLTGWRQTLVTMEDEDEDDDEEEEEEDEVSVVCVSDRGCSISDVVMLCYYTRRTKTKMRRRRRRSRCSALP